MATNKVTLIHYSYPPVVGGVESVLQKHAELLLHNGFTVKVLTGRGQSNNPDIEVKNFELFDSTNERILAIKKSLDDGIIPDDFFTVQEKIKKILQQELVESDLIIGHNICTLHKNLPLSASLYDLIQENSAPPLIAWNHDFAWTNPQYLPEMYEKWPWNILKLAWSKDKHFHVTVSEDRKSQLEKLLNISPDKINSISSGIDYERILGLSTQTNEIIKNYSLMDSYPIILLPARITKRKNIEFAVKIVDELKKYYSSTVLIVTGPPGPHNPSNKSYYAHLKNLLTLMELQPNHVDNNHSRVVFLTEFTDDSIPIQTIYELFRVSDLMLFPSFQEGFGIPILEAGITGLPIFCSDINPFHETAGESANYFDLSSDPESVATQIYKFLEEDKSAKLKKKVREEYTWASIYKNQIKPLILSALN